MTETEGKARTRLCVDLCSGLGGFSQAFVDAGWEVVTVDVEPKFKPTIIEDVRKLTVARLSEATRLGDLKAYGKVIMLMSPPCQFLSRAPGLGAVRKGTAEAVEIVAGCLRLVEEIQPAGFLLENPFGSYLRFFIGRPNFHVRLGGFGYKTVKPTAFWGNINIMQPDSPKKNKSLNAFSNWSGNKPEVRAKMPLGLSQAILENVENLA